MTTNEARELELELETGLSKVLEGNVIGNVELSLTLSGYLKISITDLDILYNKDTLKIHAISTKGDFLEKSLMVVLLSRIRQYLRDNRDKFKLLIWSYRNIDKLVK